MALRKKIKVECTIQNNDQADEILKRIGLLDLDIEKENIDKEIAITKAKETAKTKIKEFEKQQSDLKRQLDIYLRLNETEYKIKRSVQSNF
jgi:chaperonin cofactor prefoldin